MFSYNNYSITDCVNQLEEYSRGINKIENKK